MKTKIENLSGKLSIETLSFNERKNRDGMDTEQQNHVEMQILASEILRFGDLLIVANKGTGKTNALMELSRTFMADPRNRVVIFETFPKFLLSSTESLTYTLRTRML